MAIRYGDTVLCLDCFRRAKDEERAQTRRLEALIHGKIAAEHSSVAARRFSRLWGQPGFAGATSERAPTRHSVSA